tara:strand:+ start:164 stop:1852 length:1689 start_codon:yes stop_codon:yes gene_type:complete
MSSLFYDTPRNIGQAFEAGLTAPAQQLTAEERAGFRAQQTELFKQRQILEAEDARLQRQVLGKLVDYSASREKRQSDMEKEILRAKTEMAKVITKGQADKAVVELRTKTEYLLDHMYGAQDTKRRHEKMMDLMSGIRSPFSDQSIEPKDIQGDIENNNKQAIVLKYMNQMKSYQPYISAASLEAQNIDDFSQRQVFRDQSAATFQKKVLNDLKFHTDIQFTADDLLENTNYSRVYGSLKGSAKERAVAQKDFLAKQKELDLLAEKLKPYGASIDFSSIRVDDPEKEREAAASLAKIEMPKGDPELRDAIGRIDKQIGLLESELDPRTTAFQDDLAALRAHPKKAFIMNLLGFTNENDAAYYLGSNDNAADAVLDLAEQATGNEAGPDARRYLANQMGIGFLGDAPTAFRIRHALSAAPVEPSPVISAAMSALEEPAAEEPAAVPTQVAPAKEVKEELPKKTATEIGQEAVAKELPRAGKLPVTKGQFTRADTDQDERLSQKEIDKFQSSSVKDDVKDLMQRTGMSINAAKGLLKQKESGVANDGTPVVNPFKKKKTERVEEE